MTATTSEIVMHLILDWIGFLIPAYIAYRLVRFLVDFSWFQLDGESSDHGQLQTLCEDDAKEFNTLDYPKRLLTILFCRVYGIKDNPRLRLSFPA